VQTFPTAKIRNVALVGHGGAGKTSLAEALLFTAGAIPRLGRVEDGSTVCDFDEEETRRGISVSLALAPFEYDGHKVNVLDTPGYADFVTDVAAAFGVADLAVFVVSAVDGVEVQTEVAWRMAAEAGLPRIVFVNKLDRERASFEQTLEQLKDRFGAGIAPLELPIGAEAEFRGVIDLLRDTAETYADGSPRGIEGAVPDDMAAEEHAVHDALVEGIVVADDELTERYLADEPISVEELGHALAQGIDDATVFPVLCGSATKLIGVDRLARFIVEEGPEPHVAGDDGATALVVFKTVVDPYVGRVNLFKVLQGVLHTDDTLVNGRTLQDERLHQLTIMRGKDQEPAPELHAGDLGAVAKLADTGTGDILGVRGADVAVAPVPVPEPLFGIAIHAASKNDEDKLATALHRIVDEDPALRVDRDPETHQTVLRGMGETHLAIVQEKLTRKFGVEIATEPVRVAYRETVAGTAEAEGKVKKQSGGHGQFAIAWLRVEPLERGAGLEFVDKIVGGVIPRQYLPAVEKGIHETAAHGGVNGFPVVDVRVTCFDGKHHSVDSSEMAFKTAASLGFKDAMAQAQPVVLEPVSELVVTVPETAQGDVLGDLNAKRGHIQGTAAADRGEVEIVATVPTAEILRYTTDLRSLTSGRGRFTVTHSHYDPVPAHLVESLTD
jgi:elongation factor G